MLGLILGVVGMASIIGNIHSPADVAAQPMSVAYVPPTHSYDEVRLVDRGSDRSVCYPAIDNRFCSLGRGGKRWNLAHFTGAYKGPTRRRIGTSASNIFHRSEFNYLGKSTASIEELNGNHEFAAMRRTFHLPTLGMKNTAFGFVKRFNIFAGMARGSARIVSRKASGDESWYAHESAEEKSEPRRLGGLRCRINRLPVQIQRLIFWLPMLLGLIVGARGGYVICRDFWPDGRNALLILLSGPISSAGAGVLIWAVYAIPYGYCG